jgi:diguanylate cyclase (GGDEF)-like protein
LALAMHARALGTGRSLCLGLLDLDHFKRINDLASHQTGDDVLVAVARELHATLHPDALVARYGGEEFALAFPDCDRHQARQRLRTAQERLRALVVAGLPPGHTITFSAGLSDRLDPQGIDAQLREADAWLYRAKAAGRDRVLAAD